MRYPVAFNNSGSVSGSLSKANINVFISSSITSTFQNKTFGLTPTVPSDGMLIVGNNNTNPLFWSIDNLTNSSSVLDTVNKLPDRYNQVSFTNTSSALQYLVSSNKYFPLVGNEPIYPIVTDGLIIDLEANQFVSYPETGSIWYNLSMFNNSGSLINGPTFNSNGWINFDGSDDYADFPFNGRSSAVNTVEMLVRWRSNNNLGMFIGFTSYDIWTSGGRLGFNTANSDVYGISSARVSALNLIGTSSANWHYYTFVFTNQVQNNKIYINSIQETLSQQSGTTNLTASRSFQATFRLSGWNNSAGYPIPADFASVKIYNRELTQAEILQNYYQGPIVTDGLVMALDAGNLVSYESGSNIKDLSPYNNTGSLINGVGFSNQGVPCFILDGTNDRIDIPKDLNGFDHNIQYDINWTIECWMYMHTPDSTPQTYKGIYGNYNGCNYNVYPGNAQGFIIYNAGNPATVFTNFGFGPKSPTGCPDGITWNNSESSWVYNLAIEKWCHFIMTSDDGTYYKIYVNGIQQGSTKTFDFKNAASRTANNLTAARNYSWGGSFVGNEANEVDFSLMRMYNRPLNSQEILQNFNAQRSQFGI